MSTVAHFTLKHYEHLVNAGAFQGEFYKRVELIRGELIEMSPIGTAHANTVSLLTDWSYQAIAGSREISIRTQNPIRIPLNTSEPEPDVVWVKRQDYSQRHPSPQDVHLLIEVADSTLPFDRHEKLAVYAEAGVGEYWIVNLLDEQVEVYREPNGLDYLSKNFHEGDDVVSPLVLPEAALVTARLFTTGAEC